MDAWLTNLEDTLKEVGKQYQNSFDVVEEKTRQVEEHRKTILQESEAPGETLKALQDEVADLRKAHSDSFQQTMQGYAQGP